MKKILKILSQSLISIIAVVLLLFAQAKCELALPDYTANIVNIGIQQSGISSNTYEAISKSTMDKILIFTSSEEEKKILDSYKLLDKNNLKKNEIRKYLDEYPLLKDEDIYILKNTSDENKLFLEKNLGNATLIINILDNDQFDKTVLYENLANNMNISVDEVKKVDLYSLFANIPYDVKKEMINSFSSMFSEIGDSIINQFTIASVKSEYEKIGIDVNEMQINYIKNAGMKMLSIAFIAMIITVCTAYLSSRITAKFVRELRQEVVKKVVGFSTKEYKEFTVASLITRSTNDIQQIAMLVVMLLRTIIYAPILGIGALGKVSSSPLAWIIAIAVLAILVLVVVLFSFALPKFKVVQKLVDRVNLIFREQLTGISVIRAFSNENHENKRFNKASKDLTRVSLFVNRLMNIMMPTMMFIMNTVSVLIIWIGASKVNIGTIQVGDLLAFITYTMQIIMSFLMLSMVSIMIPRAWVSIKRISEIFNTKVGIQNKANLKRLPDDAKGIVEFKDVYFRYPDAQEDVLQNVSFKSLPGTTTAFIGSTGSGKSTLINLIPRLFDVTEGKIMIDGIDIRDLDIHDLRKKIGFVPQQGILFSGTIESNLKLASEQIDDNSMIKAAKIAQASEFIEQKDNKYASHIAQGGTNVSGGQKQRLAIARAIAKKPDIFVFDDSFSALDFKTDASLRKALKKELKNSTIFIVAQRISTILNADQIIVLDNGKIVGIGTHKELLKNCEVYKEIASSQLSKEEL